MGKLNNRVGKRYGRLVVVSRAEDMVLSSGRKITMWNCICDCGNTCSIATTSLGSGLTKSCGCINTEKRKSRDTKRRKYPDYDTRKRSLYKRWVNIRKRCYSKSNHNYPNYGGRGIKMCDTWRNDYLSFEKWSLEHGFEKSLTIDRIDVNGDYCPENCRWVGNHTQQRNKRNNRLITYKNETHTLSEWSDITGIDRSTISSRIDKFNWSIEDALTIPIIKRK